MGIWDYLLAHHDSWEVILDLLSKAAAAIGIPIAVWKYSSAKNFERELQELAIFRELDDQYARFLAGIVSQPFLPLYGSLNLAALSESDRQRALAQFEQLLALFERAILTFASNGTAVAKEVAVRQKAGWDSYIESWAKRPGFDVLCGSVSASEFSRELCAAINHHGGDIRDSAGAKIQAEPDKPGLRDGRFWVAVSLLLTAAALLTLLAIAPPKDKEPPPCCCVKTCPPERP